MSTTITVRVEQEVKIEAQRLAKELGLSLSSLINAFLKQLIREKKLKFTISEEPSEYTLRAIKKSEEELKSGKAYKFSDPKKAVEFIDKLIQR